MCAARSVTVIPASLTKFSKQPDKRVFERRVAGYARVSTDRDEQFSSYQAQVDYYTNFIQQHDGWKFVKVYTDEGISGTNTKNRTGFKTMIDDALNGKIDLIVTKSVSRFARNTVDTLVNVRKLKENGVEVYFEKENIYTLDSKGELLITIMSSIAQEESRSISENITWGHRKRFADGKVMMAYSTFLGYERGPDGEPAIVEKEAEVVREIYRMYLEGNSCEYIARTLTNRGILTPCGKNKWLSNTVYHILSNEKYKGSALLQKYYTVDFLSKKLKRNEGEVPQYYVENSHPAIVSPETWNLVQLELKRRKTKGGGYSSTRVLSGRIVCGTCGGNYIFSKRNNKAGDTIYYWYCNKKYRKPKTCESKVLYEKDIKEKFVEAANEIIGDKKKIIDQCRNLYNKYDDTSDIDEKIDKLINKSEKIVEENKKLINNLNQKGNTKEYNSLHSSYEKKYHELELKIDKLKAEREENLEKAIKISAFMFEFHERDVLIEEFDKKLFIGIIDEIIANHDGTLTFKFRNGKEIIK